MEEIISRLSEQLGEIIQKRVDIFTSTIYYRIIYDFHSKYKRKPGNDYDLPYDSSDYTDINSNDYYFYVSDYETIGDFLEEYSGNSIRPFGSKVGLLHQTFGDYYLNDLENNLYGTMQGFLYKIDDNDFEALTNEIYDHIPEGWHRADIVVDIGCYFNEFENSIFQKAKETINTIEQASFLFWYKKLSKQVLWDIEKEREKLRKQKMEYQLISQRERKEFKRLWSKLEKCYMLMYQKNLPEKVHMDEYHEFYRFLKQNDVTYDEVELILNYSPIQFSDKVVCLLEDGGEAEETKAGCKKL